MPYTGEINAAATNMMRFPHFYGAGPSSGILRAFTPSRQILELPGNKVSQVYGALPRRNLAEAVRESNSSISIYQLK